MSGKIALVTGGGSGIGQSAALALAQEGYQVVITGRRQETLERTLNKAGKLADLITPIAADVTKPDSVQKLFAQIKTRYGRLDLLFNNAGINIPAIPLEEVSFEQLTSVLDTNLLGVFLCTQEAIRLMKSQDPMGGRIINNGSISATTPRPHSAPYTATKHAVTGLTKSVALDGRKYNITCGQIDIGNASTDMTGRMSSGVLQADGQLATEPTMNVAHVAQAIVYMANLPADANVLFMTVMASQMPFVGQG